MERKNRRIFATIIGIILAVIVYTLFFKGDIKLRKKIPVAIPENVQGIMYEDGKSYILFDEGLVIVDKEKTVRALRLLKGAKSSFIYGNKDILKIGNTSPNEVLTFKRENNVIMKDAVISHDAIIGGYTETDDFAATVDGTDVVTLRDKNTMKEVGQLKIRKNDSEDKLLAEDIAYYNGNYYILLRFSHYIVKVNERDGIVTKAYDIKEFQQPSRGIQAITHVDGKTFAITGKGLDHVFLIDLR